jgi:hypothetical protein
MDRRVAPGIRSATEQVRSPGAPSHQSSRPRPPSQPHDGNSRARALRPALHLAPLTSPASPLPLAIARPARSRQLSASFESVSDFAHAVLGELLNLDRAVATAAVTAPGQRGDGGWRGEAANGVRATVAAAGDAEELGTEASRVSTEG